MCLQLPGLVCWQSVCVCIGFFSVRLVNRICMHPLSQYCCQLLHIILFCSLRSCFRMIVKLVAHFVFVICDFSVSSRPRIVVHEVNEWLWFLTISCVESLAVASSNAIVNERRSKFVVIVDQHDNRLGTRQSSRTALSCWWSGQSHTCIERLLPWYGKSSEYPDAKSVYLFLHVLASTHRMSSSAVCVLIVNCLYLLYCVTVLACRVSSAFTTRRRSTGVSLPMITMSSCPCL